MTPNLFDRTIDFLNSEEGKRSFEEFAKELARSDEYCNRQVERFKKHAEYRLDEVLEKIIKKYDSDEYVCREYQLGYEPRETLLWVAFNYAEKYGQPCEDPQYLNAFTEKMYTIGSYVIQVMHGQGSVIKINKLRYA